MKHQSPLLKYRGFITAAVMGFTVYFFLISLLIMFEREHPDATITNYFNAVWYSIVTFTTVGYGDMSPVTNEGKAISMVFLIGTISIFGFFVGTLANIMSEFTENKKLGLNGTKFTNHAVVFGWNQSGQAVIEQLIGVNKKVAIITNQKSDLDVVRDNYSSDTVFPLLSDYNNYELLRKSNIEKSSTVFINLDQDADKLVLILNLKKHFPDLSFVVNLDNTELKPTFLSAGVMYAVSKNEIASKLLASYIFEPDVASYSEDIMSYAEDDEDHDIKEFKVVLGNPYLGKNYGDVFYDLKKTYNCILIGISKKTDSNKRLLLKNPNDNLEVNEGDFLILIANLKSSTRLTKVFGIEEGGL